MHTTQSIHVKTISPSMVETTAPETNRCTDCRSHSRCWPSSDMQLAQYHWLRRRVPRGQVLHRMGEPFHNLYSVRSGTFKTSTLSEDGRDQITEFPMSGEIIGLDGIETGQYRTESIALEDSEVCVIPYQQLLTLARSDPDAMHQLYRTISREISRKHIIIGVLGSMTADERVSAFLMNLSARLEQRGFSPSCFVLRMTREEIGNYLGLKLETVSRVFGRLQDTGQIKLTNHRQITIIDPNLMRKQDIGAVDSAPGHDARIQTPAPDRVTALPSPMRSPEPRVPAMRSPTPLMRPNQIAAYA